MALQETQAFHIACDVCGVTAPQDSDQGTATDNATKACFVSFSLPDESPRAKMTAWICLCCVKTISKLANA